jgi:hypothetical protein
MNTIGLIIAGWAVVATALGFAVFRLTPPPLTAKSEVSLLGSAAARSIFWAYLFAPYAAVVVIAPASLFIPAYFADPDPGWERHIRECVDSLSITWAVFMGVYIVRQILKKKWP